LRFDGTTTLALQNTALYPLDTATLNLTGLVANSTVAVFAGTPTQGQVPVAYSSGTGTNLTVNYPYDNAFTTYTVRVRKAGYDPIEIAYTNSIDMSIPVAQQENKDGF
jgi:hypothetical protein